MKMRGVILNIEEIYENLTKEMQDSKIYKKEPMKKHTSFKIGGEADIFVKAGSIKDIKYILNKAKEENIQLTVVGNGSNLLVKDNGIRGITLQIDLQEINIKENIVTVGAGVKLGGLGVVLQKEGLTGFEFAAGIPGTIGGAVRMNAGAYGSEFSNIVEKVTIITRENQIKELSKEKLEFSYRHSRFENTDEIILSAELKLEKGNKEEIKSKMNELMLARKEKQPLELPSAGSTFKRGADFIAAKLIEDAGLKGYKIGGAQVSTKHSGFVVNVGNATAKDVLELTTYMKKVVLEKFGKMLELEVEIIGED